ncbi:hypothetical protein [Agrobacterium radiobacter]|uniref:hypothetical protein n=1 Tax=Agrobacterium radiobacter TaxID=362 RepID=UPI001585E14F|nr:hypothetical protein [Agrobacterium radiobacter]
MRKIEESIFAFRRKAKTLQRRFAFRFAKPSDDTNHPLKTENIVSGCSGTRQNAKSAYASVGALAPASTASIGKNSDGND